MEAEGWDNMLRPIIEIDEEKCDGCGQCVTDCAEGALEIVNGKARLVSETYCDGLGACLNCPKDALRLSMKEAPAFDEAAAMEAVRAKKAKKTLAPLAPHGHGEEARLPADTPSWPIQLALLPAGAQFLNNARVSLCAQCSGFALPDVHERFVDGHIPIIACPKLEDNDALADRLAAALKDKNIKSLDLVRMSVPCCKKLAAVAERALAKAGLDTPINETVVSLGRG